MFFVCLFVCIFEPRFAVFRLCFFKNKNPNIEIQARVTIKTGRISLLLRYEASDFTEIFIIAVVSGRQRAFLRSRRKLLCFGFEECFMTNLSQRTANECDSRVTGFRLNRLNVN